MREVTESDYLSRQLIAYIGNKRRLLPFLSDAFRSLESETPIRTFLDPFAGSGSVARLAKTLGYSVAANDWEDYAWVMTAAHLIVGPKELESLFGVHGGIERAVAELNRIGNAARNSRGERGYVASNYAPENTQTADFRRERLFYTAENARFLDAVRDRIEEWYPGWSLPEREMYEKLLLVSTVIYEAATHANTSGVFKAYHKGFGGFGRDALKRILAPAVLEVPVVWESRAAMEAGRAEASSFVAGRTADLCYLDPPYTIHQYGSNYHLLTSIALWDKAPVDSRLRNDGRLSAKAGIRPDWHRTHSDFCVRSRASAALERVIEAADCRLVALSYNTEGIVPVEEVYEIMSRMGRTVLMGTDYVLYPGGKQSMFRRTHNLEYLLVLRKGRPPRRSDAAQVRRFLAVKRFSSLLKVSYVPERMRREFVLHGEGVVLFSNGRGGEIVLPMRFHHYFVGAPVEELVREMPTSSIEGLLLRLERARCSDRREESETLMAILSGGTDPPEGKELRDLQERLARVLKKFAHRKYRETFEESCRKARRLIDSDPQRYCLLGRRLSDIERVAALRFSE